MSDLLSKLNAREKAILGAAIIVLLALSAHAFVIEPYQINLADLEQQIEQEKSNLVWMEEEARRLPPKSNSTETAQFDGSLANLIDQEVKRQNLAPYLSQMTPVGDREISIRYSKIDFNRLVIFIAKIKNKGLLLKDLRINPAENPAEVDSSLVFQKGS